MDFQIEKIEIENLLSFSGQKIEGFRNINLFIGPNNSGKSNIFRILRNCNPEFNIYSNFFYQNELPEKGKLKFQIKISETAKISLIWKWLEKYNIIDHGKTKFYLIKDSNHVIFEGLIYEIFDSLYIEFIFNVYSIYISKIYYSNKENQPLYIFDGKNFNSYDIINVLRNPNIVRCKIHSNQKKNFANILREQISIVSDPLNFAFKIIQKIFQNIRYLQDFRHFEDTKEGRILKEPMSASGIDFPEILYQFQLNEEEKVKDFLSLMREFYPQLKKIIPFSNQNEHVKKPDTEEEEHIPFVETTPNILENSSYLKFKFSEVGRAYTNLAIIFMRMIELKHDCILLIEEPEVYLHSKFQKKLVKILLDYGKSNQIFITTHSSIILNSLADYASVYQVWHDGSQSQIKLVQDNDFSSIYNDLGIKPSDYLMSNGILFLEGKTDKTILNEWMNPFLNENNIEIISFGGKHKLHFYARYELIRALLKSEFKFYYLLDRDEGNEKVLNEIKKDPDFSEEIIEFIHLLPVREIENFLISPETLFDAIKSKSTEESKDNIKKIVKQTYKSLPNLSKIKLELIIKTFLDQQPIKINFSDRNKLLEKKKIEDFEENYLSIINQKKGNIFPIDEFHKELITIQKSVNKKISSTDVWKFLPGKEVLNPILKIINEEFSSNITKEDLISSSIKTKLTEETLNHIQDYFKLD